MNYKGRFFTPTQKRIGCQRRTEIKGTGDPVLHT